MLAYSDSRAAIPRRVALLVVLIPLALVACAACGPGSGAPGDDSPVRIAARVDGEIITLDELDQWIRDDLFRREMDGDPDANLYKNRSVGVDRLIVPSTTAPSRYRAASSASAS